MPIDSRQLISRELPDTKDTLATPQKSAPTSCLNSVGWVGGIVCLEESAEEGDIVGPFNDGVEEAECAIDKRSVPLERRVFQEL